MSRASFGIVALSAGLIVCNPAMADFSGAFAPGTWTTAFVGDVAPPGPTNNGTVNTAGAPNSITIVGGNDPANPDGAFNSCIGGGLLGCEIQWLHAAAMGHLISFNWAYSTVDVCGAQCDEFGVLVNGVEQIVSDPGGLSVQSGTFRLSPSASFGFFVSTLDGAAGAATVVISGFQVPEPGSMALLGLGLAALASRRRAGKRAVSGSQA